MSEVKRWLILAPVLLAMMAAATGRAAAQATTTVQDTVYLADGAPAAGTVLVSWGGFTTAGGQAIAAGNTSATIGAAGLLTIALVPNAQATPMGSYYTAIFHLSDGTTSRQYWVVPALAAGSAPVTLAAIENQVLPTSVAMQTVSKAYVDNAIAAAETGFPTGASPYVQKAGDTMSGPLVLAADPVSPNQAADKNYVDENVASIASGVGAKVSTVPAASQVVGQPTGTQLEVNHLNGELYASQYVNPNGNGVAQSGIYNAFLDPSFAGGGTLVVDPAYSGNSYDPNNVSYGFPGDGQGFGVSSPVGNNTQVIDERDGNRSYFCSNPTANYNFSGPTSTGSFGEWYCDTKSYAFTNAPSTAISQDFGQYTTFASSVPGLDLGLGAPAPIPAYEFGVTPWSLTSTSNTAGINNFMSWQANVYNYNGDVNLLNLYANIDTGSPSPSSEGVTGLRIYPTEGNQYTGTVASGTAGANALSLTCTSNCEVIGPFGDLVDLTYNIIGTTGTFTGGSNTTATVTTAATLPVSISATMQTAITNIPTVATVDTAISETVNVATSTAITAGQLIYVCDPLVSTLSEVVKATSVGTLAGGVQSVTAMFRHSHAANAHLYIGGLAGRVAMLTSDVHNGQLFAQEIMGSPTANTFVMGTPAYGSYASLGASGTITIYHAARVMNANDPSIANVSGRYAVVADNDAFAAGDSVQESGWPVQNWTMEKIYPAMNDPYGSLIFHNDVMSGYGSLSAWTQVYNTTSTPAGSLIYSQGSFANGDVYLQDLNNGGCFLCILGWGDSSQQYNDIFREGSASQPRSYFRFHNDLNSFEIGPSTGLTLDGMLAVNPTDQAVTSTINGLTNFANNNNDHTDPTVTVSNLTDYDVSPLRLIGSRGGSTGPVNTLDMAAQTGGGSDWYFTVNNGDNSVALSNGSSSASYTCYTTGNCNFANLTVAGNAICQSTGTNCPAGALSGAAGGDLSGMYPNPTVSAVHAAYGSASTLGNLTMEGTGAAGGVSTIDFGGSYGNPALLLYDGGSSGSDGGWGYQPYEMQFFVPSSNHFSFNSGGALNASGTNELMRLSGPGGALTVGSGGVYGFGSGNSATATDTGLSRASAGVLAVGNGTAGNASGTLDAAQYLGPATAPTGSCATNGAWVFSQDGHATFCASGTWVTKI